MNNGFYRAARHSAAVLVQPWYGGILRLTGPDRISWLQGMVTNDVEKLRPGEGTYAAHLSAQGKLVGQMTILIDEAAVWLTLETANAKNVGNVLERMIVMEDVVMEDLTGQFESIAVLGPSGPAILESWIGKPLQLEKLYDHRALNEDCLQIVRDELGFTLWVRSGRSEAILQELIRLGATSIDQGTWNTVRIEHGLPIYGVDIDDTTSLPELGEKGISYDKGCYIGQEVVARIKYIGHVNRRFVGLICEGEAIAEPRSKIRANGKDVGSTTSAVLSISLNKAIALGFVNRLAAVAGTKVEIQSGERTIAAQVSELPMVS